MEKFPYNLIHYFLLLVDDGWWVVGDVWWLVDDGWLVMQNGEIQGAVKVSPPQQTALAN